MANKVAQIVTDKIIAMLDEGTVPWRRPWSTRGGDIPINAWGKRYRGFNSFILAWSRMVNGYKSNIWLTFNQISKQGGKVREGQKSELVVFWKVGQPEKVTDPDTGKVTTRRPFMLRYFLVFNLDQTHDVKLTAQQQKAMDRLDAKPNDIDPLDDAEAVLSTYFVRDGAPTLINGQDRAFYSPSEDRIGLPDREQFTDAGEYYATAFHEVTHSTAHPTRLARKQSVKWEDLVSRSIHDYAKEELVAEFGAAFLCAETGIDNTLENSAAYIATWKKRLTDDPMLLVSAAGAAQKALDYVLDGTDEDDEDAEASAPES